MKRELSMIVLAAAALLGGCTATGSGGGSVGDYAIGEFAKVHCHAAQYDTDSNMIIYALKTLCFEVLISKCKFVLHTLA